MPGSATLPEPAGEDACVTGAAADASAPSTENSEEPKVLILIVALSGMQSCRARKIHKVDGGISAE